MTSKFRLQDSFYQRLLQRLEAARQSENEIRQRLRSSGASWFKRLQEHSPTSLPLKGHLTELVETIFWTSLRKEEGRSLTFSVDYASDSPTYEVNGYVFDNPLPFDVRTLNKLAPAAGHQDVSMLVGAKDGNLQVFGLRDFSLGPLAFKVLDPGHLIIRFGAGNLAVVSGDGALFIRDPPLAKRVFSSLPPSDPSNKNFAFAEHRIQTILDIARQMRRLNHGGTLVIIPAGTEWAESTDNQRRYSGKQTVLSDMLRTLKKVKDRSGLERLIPQYAKKIAQLTAVDGATVLTTDLEVIEFGVMFREKIDSTKSVEIKNIGPFEDADEVIWKPRTLDQFGMRHHSAARFVSEQPTAIALVASQDGEVTGFVLEDGDPVVRAYCRLELALF